MAIKVGIAPDSWGVWFPQHEKQPQWWRCLDEMKVAGYEGCEIGPWDYMPNDDPQVLRSEERRVGKECRSRWSPYH